MFAVKHTGIYTSSGTNARNRRITGTARHTHDDHKKDNNYKHWHKTRNGLLNEITQKAELQLIISSVRTILLCPCMPKSGRTLPDFCRIFH